MPAKHARSAMSPFTSTAGLPADTQRGATRRSRAGLDPPTRSAAPPPCPPPAASDERVPTDLDAGQDRAVRAYTRALADRRTLHALKVRRALRVRIIGGHHARAAGDPVLQRGQ